jgi:hypothetical protein
LTRGDAPFLLGEAHYFSFLKLNAC